MIIKICGIKSSETLYCCEKNNVNFFGMIFYKQSPRNISIEKAKKLQVASEKLRISGVGVFVNFEFDSLVNYINDLDLKFIQLHGDENNNYINKIKKKGVKVIKKISLRNKSDLNKINDFDEADFFLFDYKPEAGELPGGNAKQFNWDIIKDLNINKPWFLSGGINLGNIQTIKRQFNPYGIDLSSGVEKELGIKDNDIINNFIDELNYA
mgnify:FL=1